MGRRTTRNDRNPLGDHRVQQASELAAEIVAGCSITKPPIDPLKIAAIEAKFLKLIPGNFEDAFDGRLEYHSAPGCFLLFYNTRYDAARLDGEHHPRVRFSLAHELGHYYIEDHRAFLKSGGMAHGSKGEFVSDVQIEREADSFAASLLMPEFLIMPELNRSQLNLQRLKHFASRFETSLTSAAIRCVLHSPFPCSIAAIRDGEVVWRFISEGFIDGGCYPLKKELLAPKTSLEQWKSHERGECPALSCEAPAEEWFQTFNRFENNPLWIREQYMPIPSAGLFLVLMTADENDLILDVD